MIDPTPLSRRTDPATSARAAAEIAADGTLSRMLRVALELAERYPGRTAAELEQLSGMLDGKIRKRLNDLRNRKPPLVRVGGDRRCTVTGKMAQTWHAVTGPPPVPERQDTLFDTAAEPTPHWQAGL